MGGLLECKPTSLQSTRFSMRLPGSRSREWPSAALKTVMTLSTGLLWGAEVFRSQLVLNKHATAQASAMRHFLCAIPLACRRCFTIRLSLFSPCPRPAIQNSPVACSCAVFLVLDF